MGQIFIARTSGAINIDGRRRMIAKGRTTARAGHPILDRFGDLFVPLDVDYDVEEATAVPGEKRSRRRKVDTDADTASED